jgi:hypothetical protein
MQYGLRIIFETQLSLKTKRGQMTACDELPAACSGLESVESRRVEVRRPITDVKGQEAEVRRF